MKYFNQIDITFSKNDALKYVIVSIICIFTWASCEKSDATSLQTAKMNVKVTNPKFTEVESAINELVALVLIHDGNNYTYHSSIIGKNINDSANTLTSFQLDIIKDARPVKILVLANAIQAFIQSNLQTGNTEEEIKQKIIYTYPSEGITTNLPMFGEYEFPSGTIVATETNPSITMKALPGVCKVVVNVSLDPSVFTLVSVQPFRVNSQIQIIPNSYLTNLITSAPSIPTSSTFFDMQPIQTSGNSFEDQLYLPESNAPQNNFTSEATCIVIGGKFKNSPTTTYYRLDFDPPTTDYPIGQILRDRLYSFNVTNILADGWKTPEEAANNERANISAETYDWNDLDIEINLGNSYFLNVTNRSLVLSDTIKSIASSLIFTNVFNYQLQWCDSTGVPAPSSTPGTSISNDYFKATASRNVILVESLQENAVGNGKREDYFLIKALYSYITIKVTQLDQ